MDVKDIGAETEPGAPEYESQKKDSIFENQSKNTVTIRIRRFANSQPLKITGIDPEQAVAEFEKNLSRKMQWSDRATRLSINGKIIERTARMGDVAAQIGDGVLETIPDHKVGASPIAGLSPTFSGLIQRRLQETDFRRIEIELMDLPHKPNYGMDFRVEVQSLDPKDLVVPVLFLRQKNTFYAFQLILAGYPNHIEGFFAVMPPCPVHPRGQHPHVYSNMDVCWSLEEEWKPNMMLYEHYILFLIQVLRNPKEHIACGGRF